MDKRDGEFLRLVASVSVVSAHCIHCWVERFCQERELFSLGYLATALDQFTRFTVPLFLFLSGFGLTLQARARGFRADAPGLRSYYRYRLGKILAPFLLWSAITSVRHVDFLAGLPWSARPAAAIGSLARFLLADGFDYQYYFLIVIFQFYLLYPFLYRLGRSRLWLAAFLALHLCLMSPVEVYLGLFGLSLPALHANLVIYHWFWCFAGIFAAWNREAMAAALARRSGAQVAAFWAFAFALLNLEFYLNVSDAKQLADTDHFNRWAVVVYCLACLAAFHKLKPWLAARVYPTRQARFLLAYGAPYTFFVYLAHTHVLRAVDYLFWEVDALDLVKRVILVVIGSYLAAWAAQWLLEDYPRLRFFLGLPSKPRVRWREIPAAFLSRGGAGPVAARRGWLAPRAEEAALDAE